ncbi:MAG: carbohydrate ABC transporter permease [Spirochaetales bacterium]|nr:carbohydrate ABC transporter permease [Spirochaetales bacterium]
MKASKNDIVFDTVKIIMLLFLCVVTLWPFLNTLAISLNDPLDSVRGGIGIIPRIPTLKNYTSIFKNEFIPLAARNSVFRTVMSATIQTFCTAMVAYALSRRNFMFRIPIAIIYVITMYVDAGIIPSYYLFRKLGLINNLNVYWIPGLTTAFNMLVIRTYMRGLPESFIESAKIEGANEFWIFLRIILPLCLPVLACICLFTAVWHWNAWFDTFLFTTKVQYTTLQFELMKKIQSANSAMSASSMGAEIAKSRTSMEGGQVTPQSLRAAMTIVVSVPIILVYPFLQRYFVTGLTIGGVKG